MWWVIVIILGWFVFTIKGLIEVSWWGFCLLSAGCWALCLFSVYKWKLRALSIIFAVLGIISLLISARLGIGELHIGIKVRDAYVRRDGDTLTTIIDKGPVSHRLRAISVLGSILEGRDEHDVFFHFSLNALCRVMINSRLRVREKAADVVLRQAVRLVINPAITHFRQIVLQILWFQIYASDHEYKPRGALLEVLNGEINKRLFRGQTPSYIRAKIESFQGIIWIDESMTYVGSFISPRGKKYGISSVGVYRVEWLVFLIDLKKNGISASTRLMCSDTDMQFTKNTPRKEFERWLERLPVE